MTYVSRCGVVDLRWGWFFCRHDFLGRSTARGSFLIWTHFMKGITFHETFKPVGAPRTVAYENGKHIGEVASAGE